MTAMTVMTDFLLYRDIAVIFVTAVTLDKFNKPTDGKTKLMFVMNKLNEGIKNSEEQFKVLNINSLSLQSLIFLETEIEFCLIYGTDSIKEFLNKFLSK